MNSLFIVRDRRGWIVSVEYDSKIADKKARKAKGSIEEARDVLTKRAAKLIQRIAE